MENVDVNNIDSDKTESQIFFLLLMRIINAISSSYVLCPLSFDDNRIRQLQ